MATEAQRRARNKWNAAHSKEIEARNQKVLFRLDKESDKDIISKLDSVPSKQGYIKGLIRKDISDTE